MISTETIVIEIKGKTDSAVSATDKLSQAQSRLKKETQATQAAMSGVSQAMSQVPAASTQSLVSKLGDGLKAAGFDAKTFSSGLKDIGKGLTFDLIRNGLKSLNSEIKGTAGATLSAAVNGAAMGAAFGGPLGAAIGGVAGATKGLVTSLIDNNAAMEKAKQQAEQQAQAYWDAIKAAERKKAIDEALAPAVAEVARNEKELAERAQTTNRIMTESKDAYRHASDAALAYSEKLYKINYEIRQRLELEGKLAPEKYQFDPLAGGGESDDAAEAIRNSRELRDSEIERYAASKSYGATLISLEKTESSRADRLQDLAEIMGDINVKQEIQARALKEYNELIKETPKDPRQAQFSDVATVSGFDDTVGKPIGYSNSLGQAATYSGPGVEDTLAALRQAQDAYDDEVASRGKHYQDFLGSKSESKLESIFGPAEDFNLYQSLFQGLGEAIGGTYEAIVTGSSGAGAAFRKLAADSVLAIGKQSAVQAAHELAMAAGSIATGNLAGAGAHGVAAAKYAAVAVVAGVAAHALQSGSSTVSTGGTGSGASSSSSSPSFGSGSGSDQRPIYVIVGSEFQDDSPRMRAQKSRDAVEKALRERGDY